MSPTFEQIIIAYEQGTMYTNLGPCKRCGKSLDKSVFTNNVEVKKICKKSCKSCALEKLAEMKTEVLKIRTDALKEEEKRHKIKKLEAKIAKEKLRKIKMLETKIAELKAKKN